MTSIPVTLMVCAIGLAFVLAGPADAAKARKKPKQVATTAIVHAKPHYRGAHLFPPGPVMFGNEILGDDPDPFIRQQLLRDLGPRFGPND